jgi:hypothetical protein
VSTLRRPVWLRRCEFRECLPRLLVHSQPVVRRGAGIDSKALSSGANAFCKTAGNALRSPTAARLTSGVGGSKAMLREVSNGAIMAINRITSKTDHLLTKYLQERDRRVRER